ncbi:hypothetical protein [Nocardioides sp. GXQ0305]|uniref:hypothetical protein n=1 Tax=Nocardioides sp. GXQ0305 TaxID=3423912 RepID=UPI003D7EEEC1
MSAPVLQLLDAYPPGGDDERRQWASEVRASLEERPEAWVAAVGPPGSDGLTERRAWVLLGWAEVTTGDVVATSRPDLIETVALALALLEASPLDRRDVMVVGILLHRAAVLTDADFEQRVRRGCARAGVLGERCLEWLPGITDRLPNTHEEVGHGPTFAFRRKPPAFDPAALERKLARGD